MDHDLSAGCAIRMPVGKSVSCLIETPGHFRMLLHEMRADDGKCFVILESIDILVSELIGLKHFRYRRVRRKRRHLGIAADEPRICDFKGRRDFMFIRPSFRNKKKESGAPSFIVQELAAVSIPSWKSVTRGALSRSFLLILGRMASSLVLPKRGRMTSLNIPFSDASFASIWLLSAASSASSLVMPAALAARSAPRSMASSPNSPGMNCAAVNSGFLSFALSS